MDSTNHGSLLWKCKPFGKTYRQTGKASRRTVPEMLESADVMVRGFYFGRLLDAIAKGRYSLWNDINTWTPQEQKILAHQGQNDILFDLAASLGTLGEYDGDSISELYVSPILQSSEGMVQLQRLNLFLPYSKGHVQFSVTLVFLFIAKGDMELPRAHLSWRTSGTAGRPDCLIDLMRAMLFGARVGFELLSETPGAQDPIAWEMQQSMDYHTGRSRKLVSELGEHKSALSHHGNVGRDLARSRRHAETLQHQVESQAAQLTRLRQQLVEAGSKKNTAVSAPVMQVGASAQDMADLQAQHALEIEALRSQLEQRDLEITQRSSDGDELRQQVWRLKNALIAVGGDAGEESGTAPLPTDFSALGEWVLANLSGKVHLTPKAIAGAEKSEYEDVGKAYRVLQALARNYWPMKFQGDAEARQRWLDFLRDEHLDAGPTGEAVFHRNTADHYRANWLGKLVPLDMHIQGSSSFDPKRGFRLYFHLDEDEQIIVVGALPEHLPAK